MANRKKVSQPDLFADLAIRLAWTLLSERDVVELRGIAEYFGAIVHMDVRRLKRLAHNALTLALIFGTMVSKLEDDSDNPLEKES